MNNILPKNEAARLEAIHQYQILDTDPEAAFDDLTQITAQICGTPIALINLFDENRQWFKSKVGLDISQVPRDIGLSPACINRGDVLIIPDTLADEQFATNPVVNSSPHIRFYAGAPLITPEGQTIGVLCVVDTVPRQLSSQQVEALKALSRQVVSQLELRRNLAEEKRHIARAKTLEAKLSTREKDLFDFLENGVVGLHWVGANGEILWVNQAELDLLGYSWEEYVGQNIGNFHADKEVIEDILQRLKAKETLHDYEARLLCKDGSIKYVLIDSNVLWENDKFIHTRCFTRDITERKVTEEALKAAADENLRLARAVAFVSDGIVITDPNQADNPIIYTNPAFTRMTGYQPEEALGRNCRFLQGEGTDKEAIALIRNAIAQRREVKTTILNYRKDGKPFWNEVKISPVFSDKDDLLYFVGIQTDITDRIAAEQERIQLLNRQQEARAEAEAERNRTKNILESITDAFYTLDKEWRFTYFNRQAEQILHKAAAEVLGCNIWDKFPESVGSVFFHQYHKVITEQVAVEFEEFYQPLNTWLEVHAYPSKEGLSVYFNDITERKRVEKALKESEERWQLALRGNNDGIWDWNVKTNEVFLSARWKEMLGYEESEIANHIDEWRKRVHPDDIALMTQLIEDHFAKKTPFYISEHRLLCKDGTYKWVLDRGQALWDEEGNPARMAGSHTDITERKQSEQKIRQQAALLDVATDAILVRDLNNKILFWNKGAEAVYGWKAEEAIGKNAEYLLYKYPSNQLLEAQNIALEKGEWQGELHKVTKNGKEVIVASRWTLVRDEEEKTKSILTVDTDITQKKKLETQFLRAQRMESIGTLAGGIAHDLNNVLTPILASIQILEMVLPDERSQRILTLLETNAKRGAELIKQVLSFARGVEGERMMLQVGHLIYEIEKIAKQTFPKSIEISTDVSMIDLWPVSGDATQLHQVLMNLCVNARDAMPNGGSLSITAENLFIDENYARMNIDAQVGAYIVITVVDSGMGIPGEILDRIFEPFFTTKELGKGTGLGLSTVVGIIKGHGGFINVYSEVGKGTQFKVYLPAIETTETDQENEERHELPTGNGELILVVDDEESICEVTKTSLESYGYRVLTASDGIEAIALYAQHRLEISAVLIDMMMPSMDGPTTIRALQKINPLLKIIAVSGLVSNHKLAASIGSNIKTFLSKPFTAEELLKALHEILN
ncbi:MULTISPECIES: PAS domain S-box protein [Cyanophyceae]|uniref:PAS domain S-box protein n=1 Tax=Cyanophyceae TaxID=3028117 RepID=UPI0018EFD139|nr:PAS domain S-box protein [Trichocoleus sp. FACHB-40]